MKELLYVAAWLLLGVLVTVAFIAIMCLCLAMPDILAWLSQYIGDFCTWVLFLFVVGGFIAWCINRE